MTEDKETRDEDNDKGWVDEMTEMMEEEQEQLERLIWPVKLALVKVNKNGVNLPMGLTAHSAAQAGIQNNNSTTLVLPAWKEILKDLRKTMSLMPRDIVTQWNSTFNMIYYALEH
ncbi:hypothetical protein EDC04DRAFT_2605398 [Pisolithus marmoratus]|nr:hypothetical protein EDC04DRAFT_2605398 [Pisolithus marmoratus]